MAKRDSAMQQVVARVAALEENESIGMEVLTNTFKTSRATVTNALTQLRRAGYSVKGKNGKVKMISKPEGDAPEKEAVAIPELGAQLQVTGLTLNVKTGMTSAILRNGKHAWAVELVAEVQ